MLILIFSYFFFLSLVPIRVMVPGECCFYVYCVNVHLHRKKLTFCNFSFRTISLWNIRLLEKNAASGSTISVFKNLTSISKYSTLALKVIKSLKQVK